VIRAAAAGSAADREELARRYLGRRPRLPWPPAGADRLCARSRRRTQEVFVEWLRAGGASRRPGPAGCPASAPSLRGHPQRRPTLRESPVSAADALPEVPRMRTASRGWFAAPGAGAHGRGRRLQRDRPRCVAGAAGASSLLRLRFEESLPIRTIAERWSGRMPRSSPRLRPGPPGVRAALAGGRGLHHPGTPRRGGAGGRQPGEALPEFMLDASKTWDAAMIDPRDANRTMDVNPRAGQGRPATRGRTTDDPTAPRDASRTIRRSSTEPDDSLDAALAAASPRRGPAWATCAPCR